MAEHILSSENKSEAVKERHEIVRLLDPVFRRNQIRKAILFGSYAKGTQTENSDIDILVDSGLHGLKFYGLLEDVCDTLKKPVDLIDVYQLEPSGKMMREINQTGVVIYESS